MLADGLLDILHVTAQGVVAGANMVLVALTGWGQEEHRKKSAEAGFDAHLTKPVELEALARILACSPPNQVG